MIDLRSDTVTKPGTAMRAAMASAEVGDDVYGEDPTVRALEERGAALLGKEAALFVPSGTMANQIALACTTRPGDEVLVAPKAHLLVDETGAAAALAHVQLIAIGPTDGLMTAADISANIRPPDFHYARTTLVAVENTYNRAGGIVFDLAQIDALADVVRARGLAFHLDGARMCNAAIALGVTPAAVAARFDTVSLCLSKGLGAPVGSLVAGTRAFVKDAWRRRKQVGGGMRQAGILAAAGLYALEHHVARLADDHANAARIADKIDGAKHLVFDRARVQTNVVIFDLDERAPFAADEFCARVRDRGVALSAMAARRVRAVTHLDVSARDCDAAAQAILDVVTAG